MRVPDPLVELPPTEARLDALERRLRRERLARREAEEISERTTRALYDKQRELVLLESVVLASNESTTVKEALQGAVDAICSHTGWPLGHAYTRHGATGSLMPTAIWNAGHSGHHAAFRRATERLVLTAGVGLPGRVLATGRAEWISDTRPDESFARRGLGVSGGFAFPIHAGGEVTAVLEFFTASPVAHDPALLDVMAQIGRQLGRVVERIRAYEHIAHQATHDALTGLANRVLFHDRLELALARAERRGLLAAVLFLDLDRFKDINDTLGHGAGDQLLSDVSSRLKTALRETDTLGRLDGRDFTLARFGGDEFVVLCEDLESDADAVHVAERVQAVLRSPFVLEGKTYVLTASIGVVLAGGADRGAEALLRDADIAMYRAKERGPGNWEMFDEQLRDRALERVALERGLRKALEVGELRLDYQPIVTLDGGGIRSVEALIRWQHPERGLVSPGGFIPVAEESGLIVPIGEWVLREACTQAREWRERFGDHAPLPVSVNVSARQLAQPGLPQTIRRVLADTRLDAVDLAIEVTETALIEESSVPAESLRELRALGVKILLDDFGTGYSSLSRLQRLPIDALKIDHSFVMHLDTEGGDRAIVRAIAAMANALGLEVVAECVESAAQAAEAKALGCGWAQGYHFARPAPAAAIEQLLCAGADGS